METLRELIVLTVLLPWLLTLVKSDAWGRWLVAGAALPALLAAWLALGVAQDLPWVLLGLRWGVADWLTRVWLGVTGFLWFCAGVYSAASLSFGSRHAWRFRVFFLLSMGGNFLLIIAQDMVSFYLGFAVMGLAAYGLVVQQRSVTTTRAGRVYMVWTLLGEVVLFAGVVLAMANAGSHLFAAAATHALPLAAVILLTLGFALKLAVPGLHVWLPLAHGAAPPAISAVLSGVMVKAGVLGLLRFLPAGEQTTILVAQALVWLGLLGAFYAVVFGLLQHTPKVILAYSTMSQLGLLSAFTGLVLLQVTPDQVLLAALLWYVVHHALVKAALFLGVGVFKRNLAAWVIGVLALLGLMLAGLPFTSGALAKAGIKAALPADYAWVAGVLVASTVATSLLMGRLVLALWRYRQHHASHQQPSLWLEMAAWLLLLSVVVSWYWWLEATYGKWTDALPVLGGILLSVPLWFVPRLPRLAAGDVLVWLARLGYCLRRRCRIIH